MMAAVPRGPTETTHRKDTDLHGYSSLSEWLLLLEGVPSRCTGSQAAYTRLAEDCRQSRATSLQLRTDEYGRRR